MSRHAKRVLTGSCGLTIGCRGCGGLHGFIRRKVLRGGPAPLTLVSLGAAGQAPGRRKTLLTLVSVPVMREEQNRESDEIKEVYAKFGLAMYFAQVLEHGIVNALVSLDLIPNRRKHAPTPEEWSATVDSFMSRHFEKTMGRMLRELRSVTLVPSDLEDLLRDALRRRNRLAHDFFREHAEDLITSSGRSAMLAGVDECRAVFEAADRRLDEVVAPMRRAVGLTDEVIAREFDAMVTAAKSAG